MMLEALPPRPHGLYLFTTESGSRLWFHLDDRLWLREPAPHADGRTNKWATDGCWQHLGWGPSRWTTKPTLDPERPRVGDPIVYAPGLREPPNRSTRVVSIEQVREDHAPPPFKLVVEREEAWWVVRDRSGRWHSTGTSPEEAAVAFAREADQWLDHVWKRRETHWAARWLAGRIDGDGSVLTWVLGQIREGPT